MEWGILYTRWTATSPYFVRCDAFEPFNEAFYTPETLEIPPQANERRLVQFFSAKRQTSKYGNQHLKI
jgi:hypothetical protein